MAKKSDINIHTDSAAKQAIENLCSQFGITVSDAVNIFFTDLLWRMVYPFI